MASFNVRFKESDSSFALRLGEVQRIIFKDYNKLDNKPSIEGKILVGDKSFQELGLDMITPQEIDEIIFGGG